METKSLSDIVAQRNKAVLYCQLVRHCFTVMLPSAQQSKQQIPRQNASHSQFPDSTRH
jgi:hypothetical protein